MKKFKIKKGDTVYINAGNDKGKTGKVLSVITEKDRVIVEGVNLVSKHTKPNSKQPQGGILKQEASIHISNVNLLDPSSTAAKPVPTRVGYKMDGDKKVRIAKKSGQEIK
jgi:large subunit ribosomal protein L24